MTSGEKAKVVLNTYAHLAWLNIAFVNRVAVWHSHELTSLSVPILEHSQVALITNVQLCSCLLNVIIYRQNTIIIHSGAIVTYLLCCQRSLLFGEAVAFVSLAILNIYLAYF